MGSLRQEQKEENVADSFILEWKTPQYKDKVLVLVEGEGDYKFYYKFFNVSKTAIRYSQGCSKHYLLMMVSFMPTRTIMK